MNFYWFISRFSSVLLVFTIFLDLELTLFLINLFLLHLYLGLKSLISDYIHDIKLEFFLILLLRILILRILLLIIEILY
nr:succinate dehydrogenase subunit 4 [Pleonosporium sp.]